MNQARRTGIATLIAASAVVCACCFISSRTGQAQGLPFNTAFSTSAVPLIAAQGKIDIGAFYVVRQAFSDKGPGWSDTILDVRQEVAGVRVREIRIAPMNRNCSRDVTVKAVERVLLNTTVTNVAGKFKLCSYPEDDFSGVIQVARRSDVEADSLATAVTQTIVAKCGTQERLYELPDPEMLKFDALKLADSRITALWDLRGDVVERAFGKAFSFSEATAEQNKGRQELGAKIVPEIMAGKFDSGFPDRTCPYAECRDHNAKSALQGYAGPMEEKDPAFVELANAASLHLAKFDLPPYPREAQRIHTQGEVRLRIFFDPETGSVTNVEPESGDDKLQEVAANAARTWQFQTGVALKTPVEVTLRFGFHCPAK
jgi:hypothetical protein